MSKVLIVLSHTDYDHSFANKELVEKLMKMSPNVELDHIDQLSPDLKFDIKKEQENWLEMIL